jgi:uncharacterized protein
MHKPLRLRATLVLLLAALAFPAREPRLLAAPLAVPQPKGYVNDLAGLLTERQRSTLETLLRTYEEKTTNQVVLLVIDSLEGEDLESYSLRVAEEWKIGQKGKDNGVLFLVVLKDRKARIEVGYGLEGSLPDAVASRILRQIVFPAFRQGNYFGGIAGGLEAILQATEGEFQAPAGETGASDRRARISASTVFFFFVLFLLLSSRMGRLLLLGSLLGGGRPLGQPLGGRRGGFGGFSGGGGHFGGGGASGSW